MSAVFELHRQWHDEFVEKRNDSCTDQSKTLGTIPMSLFRLIENRILEGTELLAVFVGLEGCADFSSFRSRGRTWRSFRLFQVVGVLVTDFGLAGVGGSTMAGFAVSVLMRVPHRLQNFATHMISVEMSYDDANLPFAAQAVLQVSDGQQS